MRELAGIMRAWCAPGGASSRTHSHNPRLVRELAAQGNNFEGFGGELVEKRKQWFRVHGTVVLNGGGALCALGARLVRAWCALGARLVRAWCALAGASSRTKRA